MNYIVISSLNCCGIKEIAGIAGDPQDGIIRDVCESRYRYGTRCAYYIYSDTNSQEYAKELTKFIRENDLGHVEKMRDARNPNSGNKLNAYVWKVNELKLYAWGKEKCGIVSHLSTESWLMRYSSEYETSASMPAVAPVRFMRRVRMFITEAMKY